VKLTLGPAELAVQSVWTARAVVIPTICHWPSGPGRVRALELAQDPLQRQHGVEAVPGSLCERLGGTDVISAVVRVFEQRSGKDGRINKKFARTNFERVTKEFVDQLCQDTGGPCSYTGLSMKQSHTNMGVTSGEFDAFVEDFIATLNDFNVGNAEQDELVAADQHGRREIIRTTAYIRPTTYRGYGQHYEATDA
jgi:hemoglobin